MNWKIIFSAFVVFSFALFQVEASSDLSKVAESHCQLWQEKSEENLLKVRSNALFIVAFSMPKNSFKNLQHFTK
jgi:hypothetical protein